MKVIVDTSIWSLALRRGKQSAFPSVQEGQGITLLEAQASATPVVSFNLGGHKRSSVEQTDRLAG